MSENKKTVIYENEKIEVYKEFCSLLQEDRIYYGHKKAKQNFGLSMEYAYAIYNAIKNIEDKKIIENYSEYQFTISHENQKDIINILSSLKDYELNYEVLFEETIMNELPEIKVIGNKMNIQNWFNDIYSSDDEDNIDNYKYKNIERKIK